MIGGRPLGRVVRMPLDGSTVVHTSRSLNSTMSMSACHAKVSSAVLTRSNCCRWPGTAFKDVVVRTLRCTGTSAAGVLFVSMPPLSRQAPETSRKIVKPAFQQLQVPEITWNRRPA